MKKAFYIALASVGVVMISMAGCRDEQALYRYDTPEAMAAISTTNESMAEAVPYVLRARYQLALQEQDEVIEPAFLMVRRVSETTNTASDLFCDATEDESAMAVTELLLLDEAASDQVALTPAGMSALVNIETEESVAEPAPAQVMLAQTGTVSQSSTLLRGWVESGASRKVVAGSPDGPELDSLKGELIRPGQLSPRPLAEVMISYAPQRQAKKKVITLGFASMGWVESRWTEGAGHTNRLGRTAY